MEGMAPVLYSMSLNAFASNSWTVVPGCESVSWVSYLGRSHVVTPSPTMPGGQMHSYGRDAFSVASKSWHAAFRWHTAVPAKHSLMLTFLEKQQGSEKKSRQVLSETHSLTGSHR